MGEPVELRLLLEIVARASLLRLAGLVRFALRLVWIFGRCWSAVAYQQCGSPRRRIFNQ
jgi:hypothetical protein